MSAYRDAVTEARLLVREHQQAMLATASAEMDGWPFGSVAPYVLDYAGNPLLLMSDLAQHVRNVRRDDRASLLVWQAGEADLQKAARVTLMGRVAELDGDDTLRDRYARYLPQSKDYLAIHDFRFYRLAVERVRYIGGFGQIHWLRGEDYRLDVDAGSLWSAEAGAVAHMNTDHATALLAYARSAGIDARTVRLIGIDPEGFDIDCDGRRHRLRFQEIITSPQALRAEFIRRSQALGGQGEP